MVTPINIALDDDVHEESVKIKEELDLTWEQYIKEANECLSKNRV